MNRKTIQSAVAFALLAIAGLGVYSFGPFKTEETAITEPVTEQSIEQPATQSITTNEEGVQVFSYDGEAGVDALTTLKSLTETITEDSEFGEFVSSIGGVEANANDNEFWEFNVNGEPASVGAGSYTAEAGDSIEWKLSSF